MTRVGGSLYFTSKRLKERPPLKRWQLAAYVLLWLLFAQVGLAARQTSITLDEPLHITSGYASLVTGDYRLVEEHPPLLKMLQALPLLLAQPALPDPRQVPGWEDGDLIVAAQNTVVPYRPIDPLVMAARVPTMLVALLLAALVYRWAADAFGAAAGLLALTLLAFDPNILAHSGVAATDIGAACAIFAATYTFWRWIRDASGPSWRRCFLAAVVLGLALGVKTTVLLVLPVFTLFILFGRPQGSRLWPYLGQAAVAAVVAFVVLWGIYRFEIGPVANWPIQVPAASHFSPLIKLQEHMRDGHSAFLMGQNYHDGRWYYFPVAFLVKTPLLTLALLLLTALGLVLRRLRSPGLRAEMALLAVPVLYFGVSLASTLNIGYRHLLPVLPFLFVWVSRWAPAIAEARPVWRWAGGAAVAGYAVASLALFPWYLAYFNLFAGGVDGGYRFLTDSNLDWGQTWKALAQYLDEEGISEFALSQYTINDPHAYGLDFKPLPPWPEAPPVLPRRFNPEPGTYAISATTLQGVVIADVEMFDYFRKLEPVERVGHAMFVYQIEERPEAHWVAQCTNPVVPLPSDVLTEGLGRADLRVAVFDCSQSWLYPPGNGWYVLARDREPWAMVSEHLQRDRLAFEQRRPGFVPPFEIYEWFELDPLADMVSVPVHAAPSDWAPRDVVQNGVALQTPVQVGDALEFLGYVAADDSLPAGHDTAVQTYWRVREPPQGSLSLMAHVLAGDGLPIAVGDALGVPADQWRPGDVIVQRHVLNIPPDTPAGEYWLQVGAYTLPEVERLPVYASGSSAKAPGSVVGDRLLVGTIEVTVP